MTVITFDSESTVVPLGEIETRVLLKFDPPATTQLMVEFAHSGSAEFGYGADWVSPSAIDVPADKASFPVKVKVFASFVPPKDAVIEIVAGSGYTVGADFLHTLTRAAEAPA